MGGELSGTAKGASLVFLVVHSTFLPLLMRHIRTRDVEERFINTAQVLALELIKTAFAAFIIIIQEGSVEKFVESFRGDVLGNPLLAAKSAVPAGLYLLQNTLYLVAVSNLSAPIFIVLYQLKILTTAFLAVYVLGKDLRKTQYISLFILLLGVCIVELSTHQDPAKVSIHFSSNPVPEKEKGESHIVGLLSVIIMAFCSGFAGIYTEKMMKESKSSVWMENLRLELSTLPLALISMFANDGKEVFRRGWLVGIDSVVVGTSVVGAVGGLVIALILRHCGSIAKTYAQCLAIIFTAFGSMIWFHTEASGMFWMGCAGVVGAIGLYNYNPAPSAPVLPSSASSDALSSGPNPVPALNMDRKAG